MILRITLLTVLIIATFCSASKAQDIPPYIPQEGLIGWWPFNGNADDESGNGNNGTSNGAVLTTDRFGAADSAYSFDGQNSYISIPSSPSLESPSTQLTMSAWVYLDGPSQVGQPFSPIITKTNNGANEFMYRFDIDIDLTGFYAGTNNWNSNVGVPYAFQLNQWYMVSAVLDSDSAYLFLDDTLVASIPYTTSIQQDASPLEFGRDTPGYIEIFNGKIDDIGIWNRALSHDEITAVYSGIPLGTANAVNENQFRIYPNPASESVDVIGNNNPAESEFTLTNDVGKIALRGKLKSGRTTIPLTNMPAGLYFLNVNGDCDASFKLIKQ